MPSQLLNDFGVPAALSQESLLRSVRAFVIFAGSEEIMLDLGARQMVRMQRSLQDAGPAPKAKITMTAKV